LDNKQRRIILSWFERSQDLSSDPYASFIALWISFNAYCYARYAETANKRRADLRIDRGLKEVTSERSRAEGTVFLDSDFGRFKLEIDKPGRISIILSERYTEDIIFSRFAKTHQRHYEEWLKQEDFLRLVEAFRDSLAKNDKFYVINMARIRDYRQYDPNKDYKELIARNIIVTLDSYKKLAQLKNVLYQVRCNVFHGEKVPGDVNDDRIVKKAQPVLYAILEAVIGKRPSKWGKGA